MTIQVQGVLLDPINQVSRKTSIRITALTNTGTALKTSSNIITTGSDGSYDFPLEDGAYEFEAKYENQWNYIGAALVSGDTTTPIDINSLLNAYPYEPVVTPPVDPDNPHNTDPAVTESIEALSERLNEIVSDTTGFTKGAVRVRNGTTGVIPKNTLLYAISTGALGVITVGIADSSSLATMYAIGAAKEDIPLGELGHAISLGLITEIDTSLYNEGDAVYVGDNGAFSATIPTTGVPQAIGRIQHSDASYGSLFILGFSNAQNTSVFKIRSGFFREGVNQFTGSDIQDALNQRDTYFSFHPAELAAYSVNTSLVILVSEGNHDYYMHYTHGSWDYIFNTPVDTSNQLTSTVEIPGTGVDVIYTLPGDLSKLTIEVEMSSCTKRGYEDITLFKGVDDEWIQEGVTYGDDISRVLNISDGQLSFTNNELETVTCFIKQRG